MVEELVEEIKKLQELRGLSDSRFAGSIGVDHSLWSKIKNGKALPGGKFLRGVMRTYPELIIAVNDYMRGEVPA